MSASGSEQSFLIGKTNGGSAPISTPPVTSSGRWSMRNGSALTLDQAALFVAREVPAVALFALDDLGDGKQAFPCILRQSR